MLIIEVWTGSCWKLVGRIKPGTSHAMADRRANGEERPLNVVVEHERTVVCAGADEQPLVELREHDQPWERLLNAPWMRAPMLCRLHHRTPKPQHKG